MIKKIFLAIMTTVFFFLPFFLIQKTIWPAPVVLLPINWLSIFVYFYLFLSCCFLILIPGYVFSYYILGKNQNANLRLVFAPAFSFLFYALLAIFFLKARINFGFWLIIGLNIIFIFWFFLAGIYRDFWRAKSMLLIFFLSAIFIFIYNFTFLIHYPDLLLAQTDYLFPYHLALVFNNGYGAFSEGTKELLFGYWITTKMPLLSLTEISFFRLLGQNIFVHQIFSMIIVFLFVLPIYYVLEQFIKNKNWLKIIVIANIINVQFLMISIYNPPRFLAAYFIFCFYLLLFFKDIKLNNWLKNILAGLCVGLAFIAHSFSAPYLAIGFLYLLIRKENLDFLNSLKKKCFDFLIILVTAILTILPWLFWALKQKTQILYSSQLDLPFIHATDWAKYTDFKLTQFSSWPARRWEILTKFLSSFNAPFDKDSIFHFWTYRTTLEGAITYALLIFAFIGLIYLLIKYFRETITLILGPILLTMLTLAPWIAREGTLETNPSNILLVTIGVTTLLFVIKNKFIKIIILALYFWECFYIAWFVANTGKVLMEKTPLLFLPMISAYCLLFVYIIYLNFLNHNEKS